MSQGFIRASSHHANRPKASSSAGRPANVSPGTMSVAGRPYSSTMSTLIIAATSRRIRRRRVA
jgi:hypothetical protein